MGEAEPRIEGGEMMPLAMPGAMPGSNAQPMLRAKHATNATYERNVRVQDSQRNPSVSDARTPVDNPYSPPLGDALTEAWEQIGRLWDGSYERMSVRNNIPRPPSEENHALWGALMRRDNGRCWMCGWNDMGRTVIEHLRPRSNFPPEQIELADRSDNLRIACWECNTVKGNRDVPFRKPLPIVWFCTRDDEGAERQVDEDWFTVWCDRCQAATVVPPHWHIARLRAAS